MKGKISELDTERKRILETYIQASMNLRRVTSLELTSYRMKKVICLHIPTVF
jgi:hypothetical protein